MGVVFTFISLGQHYPFAKATYPLVECGGTQLHLIMGCPGNQGYQSMHGPTPLHTCMQGCGISWLDEDDVFCSNTLGALLENSFLQIFLASIL